MLVTIWDLDYYGGIKQPNPDVMKIASYHEQLGDTINFVLSDFDRDRQYDLCYIIKNNAKTKLTPPVRFFLDKNVRFWGEQFAGRINWRMNDIMLGVRPDYLLYPDIPYDKIPEYLRLFNSKAQPLNWIQDWRNTFKNREVIVTDPYIWAADEKSLSAALIRLQEIKNVSFLEPIWVQKLVSNKVIKDLFFQLDFAQRPLLWNCQGLKDEQMAISLMTEFKDVKRINLGALTFDYRQKGSDHWASKDAALADFARLRELVVLAKRNCVPVKILMPRTRFETPYFELFEALSDWTERQFKESWLIYLTKAYGKRSGRTAAKQIDYWNHPRTWHPVFRDLLLQTYKYKEFLTATWGEKKVSDLVIPWKLFEKEFVYEI